MFNLGGLLKKVFSKIDVSDIFKDHLLSLKKYRQNSYAKNDIFVFFVLPLLPSLSSVFLGLKLDKDISGILINVFAIFAGFLFNLLVLVYELISKAPDTKKEANQKNLRLDKLKQITANISFEIILSILNILLLIISPFFYMAVNKTEDGLPNAQPEFLKVALNNTFSFVVFYFTAMFILKLFMLLKRIYTLLNEEIDNQRRSV